MNKETENKLFEAWAYCDMMDKSTEFMLQFMADSANVDYDEAVDFVCNSDEKDRSEWYKNNSNWYLKYKH